MYCYGKTHTIFAKQVGKCSYFMFGANVLMMCVMGDRQGLTNKMDGLINLHK